MLNISDNPKSWLSCSVLQHAQTSLHSCAHHIAHISMLCEQACCLLEAILHARIAPAQPSPAPPDAIRALLKPGVAQQHADSAGVQLSYAWRNNRAACQLSSIALQPSNMQRQQRRHQHPSHLHQHQRTNQHQQRHPQPNQLLQQRGRAAVSRPHSSNRQLAPGQNMVRQQPMGRLHVQHILLQALKRVATIQGRPSH